VILSLPGELNNQDRVLRSQPDQHHETNLREDVDGHASEVEPGSRSQQTHWHDEHDRER
jgi:hypothetical protein